MRFFSSFFLRRNYNYWNIISYSHSWPSSSSWCAISLQKSMRWPQSMLRNYWTNAIDGLRCSSSHRRSINDCLCYFFFIINRNHSILFLILLVLPSSLPAFCSLAIYVNNKPYIYHCNVCAHRNELCLMFCSTLTLHLASHLLTPAVFA